jgi:hypothetical protein
MAAWLLVFVPEVEFIFVPEVEFIFVPEVDSNFGGL